jgi:serine/threonine protein kinase
LDFEDQFGNVYKRGARLGEGGQGAAYRVEGEPSLALKVAVQPGTDEPVRAQTSRRIRGLLLLPLPVDLPLAKPIAVLTGVNGYVMKLVSGLEPIETVIHSRVPESKPIKPSLEALKHEFPKDVWEWFHSYGEAMPTKQRLLVAASLAATVARLHSLGLHYSDISPGNCFVPESRGDFRAWLIDCDNIALDGTDHTIYTPGYGAPEVAVLNRPNNTSADIFSLTVLAYQIITTKHPYSGPARTEGRANWDSDDAGLATDEGESKWQMSMLPYVHSSEDESNREPDILLPAFGAELENVFQETLGVGREEPHRRVSAALLARALLRSGFLCCTCDNCGFGLHAENVMEGGGCAFCNEPLGIRWGVWRAGHAGGHEELVFVSEPNPTSFEIPISAVTPPRLRALFNGWIRITHDAPAGRVRIEAVSLSEQIRVNIGTRTTEPSAVVEVDIAILRRGIEITDSNTPSISARLRAWGNNG